MPIILISWVLRYEAATPHLALARKYRPRGRGRPGRGVDDAAQRGVLGQVAHAYLFFGPRASARPPRRASWRRRLTARRARRRTCGRVPVLRRGGGGQRHRRARADAASHTQVDKIREMIIETVALRAHARPAQGLHHRRSPHAYERLV